MLLGGNFSLAQPLWPRGLVSEDWKDMGDSIFAIGSDEEDWSDGWEARWPLRCRSDAAAVEVAVFVVLFSHLLVLYSCWMLFVTC